MFRSLLVVLGLGVAGLLPLALADDKADETAVRAVAQRYFAAYAKKDLDGFMALWSEKSPDFKSRKQTMQRIFGETEDIRLKALTIVKATVTDEAAQLRVRVELASTDKRSGKPHADMGRLNRLLDLVREDGAWKVRRYGPAELLLLDRLLAADGKAGREKLYQDEKDLVALQLVIEACRLCNT